MINGDFFLQNRKIMGNPLGACCQLEKGDFDDFGRKMWKNRKMRNLKIDPLPLRSWIWEGGVDIMEDKA